MVAGDRSMHASCQLVAQIILAALYSYYNKYFTSVKFNSFAKYPVKSVATAIGLDVHVFRVFRFDPFSTHALHAWRARCVLNTSQSTNASCTVMLIITSGAAKFLPTLSTDIETEESCTFYRRFDTTI